MTAQATLLWHNAISKTANLLTILMKYARSNLKKLGVWCNFDVNPMAIWAEDLDF